VIPARKVRKARRACLAKPVLLARLASREFLENLAPRGILARRDLKARRVSKVMPEAAW
jgi:hypothetical protein